MDVVSLAENVFPLSQESIHRTVGAPGKSKPPWGLNGSDGEKGRKIREGIREKSLETRSEWNILSSPEETKLLSELGQGCRDKKPSLKNERNPENSLEVQWLGPGAFPAGAWIQSLVREQRSHKPCGLSRGKRIIVR